MILNLFKMTSPPIEKSLFSQTFKNNFALHNHGLFYVLATLNNTLPTTSRLGNAGLHF